SLLRTVMHGSLPVRKNYAPSLHHQKPERPMKKTISATMIRKLALGNYDVYDRKQPRLVLRVRPTGRHSYLVRLGRGKWYTLGQATDFTPDLARKLTQGVLGDVAHGRDPIAEKRKGHGTTFDEFISEKYEPWAIANMKHGQWQVDRIRTHFSSLFGTKR